MTSPLLKIKHWQPIAQKHKVKDNSLLRAIAAYEKIPENKFDQRAKGLNQVAMLVLKLMDSKEAEADKLLQTHLEDMETACRFERGFIEEGRKEVIFGSAKTPPAKPAPANSRAMQPDCKPVRGKVPGPANHLLCDTHKHVLDVTAKVIIADSLEEYKKTHPAGGGKSSPATGGGPAYAAKKVIQDINNQKQKAEKLYNDIIKKFNSETKEALGPEGQKIRDELIKARKQAEESAKVIVNAANDLVKRKTGIDAAEGLKKLAEAAKPKFVSVEDLSKKATAWWNSD